MIENAIRFFNRHLFLSIIWLVIFLNVIYLSFKRILLFKINIIDDFKAIRLINKKNAIIIDIRVNNLFQNGHIINSINLTFKKNSFSNNQLKKIEIYKNKPIILVSENEVESFTPAIKLLKYGFKKVFILKGGIFEWKNKNLPLISNK